MKNIIQTRQVKVLEQKEKSKNEAQNTNVGATLAVAHLQSGVAHFRIY
jgi:hypothetical protein